MTQNSPGAKFRLALKQESPLQVIGAICAYHALLAKRSGYRAIYLSGGGVAAGSLGMPDLGISQPRRRADRHPPHHRRLRPAAAGRRRHRLRRERLQRRPHDALADQVRRRRDAHRGPGRRQALRPPPRQGAGVEAGDVRPHQGRGRRAQRSRFRRHGAHRRAGERRPRARARARRGLRRGRRRHDLPRGDHRARHVPQVRRRGRRCPCSPTSPNSARRRCSPSTSCARPAWRWRSIRCRPSAP